MVSPYPCSCVANWKPVPQLQATGKTDGPFFIGSPGVCFSVLSSSALHVVAPPCMVFQTVTYPGGPGTQGPLVTGAE